MKQMTTVIYAALWLLSIAGCNKKSGGPAPAVAVNHSPAATLDFTVTRADPFTVQFSIVATDADNDPLSYQWNFGEGTQKKGSATETFSYPANKTFTVSVEITDGRSPSLSLATTINTTVTTVVIDQAQKFQQIEGFGGFGARDVYWSKGPFTGAAFVNSLINDLGITILRDNIPTDFENVNDDNDPLTTNPGNFALNSLNDRLQYLKDMKTAGLQKLIVSIWSAPPWMKTNNRIDNGTTANAAPAYNPHPTASDNQLRPELYEEFAERCVAYIRIIKLRTALDVYALSLQNEPRFSQSYESCVFDGAALANLIKVVGRRLRKEGLPVKIFMPEDVGWYEGTNGLIQPILKDAEAMSYVGMIATHGYAFDGVTASSTDAQTWKDMYNWGAPQGKPLWMTETSGFTNDMNGAVDLGKAMYTALTYGNISAWLFWSLSTSTLDAYCLMSSSGDRSKRYYVSKNFYHFIRPGAYRVAASALPQTGIYPLAFELPAEAAHTVILVNDSATSRAVQLSGTNLPAAYSMFVTSQTDDCKEDGTIDSKAAILLPAKSVVTLYRKD